MNTLCATGWCFVIYLKLQSVSNEIYTGNQVSELRGLTNVC